MVEYVTYSKEWYKSKTMWAGILTVLAGVATSVAGQITAGVPLTLVGVMNIILRNITESGIVRK